MWILHLRRIGFLGVDDAADDSLSLSSSGTASVVGSFLSPTLSILGTGFQEDVGLGIDSNDSKGVTKSCSLEH